MKIDLNLNVLTKISLLVGFLNFQTNKFQKAKTHLIILGYLKIKSTGAMITVVPYIKSYSALHISGSWGI